MTRASQFFYSFLFCLQLSPIVQGQASSPERQQAVLKWDSSVKLLYDSWDKYCPAVDNKTITFGKRDFILHCENSIFFESTPNAKDIKTCGESCHEDSCLGAYMEKDGYCIKAVRSPEDRVAVMAPAPLKHTITSSTTIVSTSISTETSVAITTIISTSTSTQTSLKTTTSTSTITSIDSNAQVETRTFFLNPTGGSTVPAPGNYAPVYKQCGGAAEIWTIQGKRYGYYVNCTAALQGWKYQFVSTNSVGGCIEAFAKAPAEFDWAYTIWKTNETIITTCALASKRAQEPRTYNLSGAIFPL